MAQDIFELITGELVEGDQQISLAELCSCCRLPAERMIAYVNYGIIEPKDPAKTTSRWEFSRADLLRAQAASRLESDLGVNLAGAALALELLDEVRTLRRLVMHPTTK